MGASQVISNRALRIMFESANRVGPEKGCYNGCHISWNQGDYNQPHNKKNNSNNQKLNHSEILPGKGNWAI